MDDHDRRNGPVAELEAEHRLIQQVVAGLVYLEAQVRDGRTIDPALLPRIVEFLGVYADQFHHGKEEALLFPLLEKRGVPAEGCPVGALLGEHRKGRALRADLIAAVDAYTAGADGSQDQLAASMKALADLYPAHIWKEDYLLFPLSEKVLTPADRTELTEGFGALNRQLGQDALTRFARLAEELSAMVSGR